MQAKIKRCKSTHGVSSQISRLRARCVGKSNSCYICSGTKQPCTSTAHPESFSPRFVPKCWRQRRFPCAVWPNLDLTPRDTGLFLLACSNTSISGSWPLMMEINPCIHSPIHPKAAGSAWSKCSTKRAGKLLLRDKTESSVSCKITGIPSCWNIRGFTAKCSLVLNISAAPLRLWCLWIVAKRRISTAAEMKRSVKGSFSFDITADTIK